MKLKLKKLNYYEMWNMISILLDQKIRNDKKIEQIKERINI